MNGLLQRSDDRTGFYTAQEDLSAPVPKSHAKSARPPAPPGAKKASQPKRVSNAALAEQLMALSAQMQLLAHRQDQLEKASSSSAVAAPEPQSWTFCKVAFSVCQLEESQRNFPDPSSKGDSAGGPTTEGAVSPLPKCLLQVWG